MKLCKYCAKALPNDDMICCQDCWLTKYEMVKPYESMFWSVTTYDATDQLKLYEHPLMQEIINNKLKALRLSLIAGYLQCTTDGIFDMIVELQRKLGSKEDEVKHLEKIINDGKDHEKHDHYKCHQLVDENKKLAEEYKAKYVMMIREFEDLASEHNTMREKGEKRIRALKHALNGINEIINNSHHTELAMYPKTHDMQELIKEVMNIG